MSSDASRPPAKRARRTPVAAPPKKRRGRKPKASAPHNGVTTATTTTTTTTTPAPAAADDGQKGDEAELLSSLYYLPNREIPPITPTPPSECPLGRRRRTAIVSRQYDVTSGQPVYRVRVERCVPGEEKRVVAEGGGAKDSSTEWSHGVESMDDHGTNGDNNVEGGNNDGAGGADDDDAEEHSVGLADILDWVSPAELERFELEWEDDMVFITDEDGAVLLVSREVQRAMMGWPAAAGSEQTPAVPVPHDAAAADGLPAPVGAAAVPIKARGPGRPKKRKVPTKEFVDLLPPVRRRGRPPKKMLKTAEVMGVVGGEDSEEAELEAEPDAEPEAVETGSETAEYGEWVDPANVRGTAAVPGSAHERDELALSEESNQPSGQRRAGEDILSREQSSEYAAWDRRGGRSATRSSTVSSHARRTRAQRSEGVPPSNMSLTASPVRRSKSAKGARLRRSSISSNGSTNQSFHSAGSRRHSLRSGVAPSRSSSEAGADNRATSLLSASNFTRQPASQRQGTEESNHIADLDATPRASKPTTTQAGGSKPRRSSPSIPTPSSRHQASSMLHPPAEGASWDPEPEKEEYEVESIITHKFFGEDWYYMVRWANWPPDEVSWLKAEELADAKDVLDSYHESIRRKKNRAKSRKGKERAVKDDDGDVDMVE